MPLGLTVAVIVVLFPTVTVAVPERDKSAASFTVTEHVSFFPLADAVTVAVPAFNAVTLPFESTDATDASEL